MVFDAQELRDVLRARLKHLLEFGIERYHGREIAKMLTRCHEIADAIEKADITKSGFK